MKFTAEQQHELRVIWKRRLRDFAARVARDERQWLTDALERQRRLLEDAVVQSGGRLTMVPEVVRGGHTVYRPVLASFTDDVVQQIREAVNGR